MIRKSIALLFIVFCAISIFANTENEISTPVNCQSCVYASSEVNATSISSTKIKMTGIIFIVTIATIYGWRTFRKKYYILFGSLAILSIAGSYAYSIVKFSQTDQSEINCVNQCGLDSVSILKPIVLTDILPVENTK